MANLYTSSLITYTGSDPIEDETTEFSHSGPTITIEHYNSSDELQGTIVPAQVLIENYNGSNTRMRVYPESGQIPTNDKIKIIVDD